MTLTLAQADKAIFDCFYNNVALQHESIELIDYAIVNDFVHCILEVNGVRDSIAIDVNGNILN